MGKASVSQGTGKSEPRSGTQTLERSIRLLKLIASRGRFGWRLSDLAEYCQMSKGTTHRLLAGLIRERLVRRRNYDRHYLPGALLFELSLALPAYSDFLAAAQAPLKRIARATGMVAYLFLRSGEDFVCAARHGSTEIKALSINKGTRRPLLSAAGGIAMLITLDEAEFSSVVKHNLAQIERFGPQRIKALQAVLRESKRCGFGLHQGQIVPGVHALGVAVRNSSGKPLAALTVVGAAEKLPPARVSEFASMLNAEAAVLSEAASRYGVAGDEPADAFALPFDVAAEGAFGVHQWH
jgi:DNA-binding IclR family transcriptional regulator